ncbi:HEPN domain-containing protein [Telmatospirillum sp.]|uniref:HEPN domain-containing protein n=1 Tax=Telmatospirillum sp. TaxID=2079197 RepID=UPI00284B2774|nr:HEPN domain-containing protein [Telmatospirillum sp.]MDR3439824.1 HEPN domain-containing protein [Telmatospirillum sp.]
MPAVFQAITDDFIGDLDAIRDLIATFSDAKKPGKIRLAAANSATLLVAATFEEFAREMAREYARAVVQGTESFEKLPRNLASTAWKRTMDGLGKVKFDGSQKSGSDVFSAAQARFAVVYEFCKGDLSKDIYRELIHNENNMRPAQLNGLFKVSGLGDVCTLCSDKQPLLDIFGETEPEKAHGKLLSGMEDFFERRNEIAHALNPGQSSSPGQIATDIDMLESFGRALCETLHATAPPPHATTPTPDRGDDAPQAVAEAVPHPATLAPSS